MAGIRLSYMEVLRSSSLKKDSSTINDPRSRSCGSASWQPGLGWLTCDDDKRFSAAQRKTNDASLRGIGSAESRRRFGIRLEVRGELHLNEEGMRLGELIEEG